MSLLQYFKAGLTNWKALPADKRTKARKTEFLALCEQIDRIIRLYPEDLEDDLDESIKLRKEYEWIKKGILDGK